MDSDHEANPTITVTKPGSGSHPKANGKWDKFMSNGKAEPVANGTPGIKLDTLSTLSKPEHREHRETQFTESKRHQPGPTAAECSMLLQTLLDIKQDIKNEVSVLSTKMNRLDTQIEAVRQIVTFESSRRDSSPSGSTLRIESDYLTESAKSSSSDARSTSPDSNSSIKAAKRLGKLTKGSKVSPTPQVPPLNDTGSSPVKSKSTQRQESGSSLAAVSGVTTTTTVDMGIEDLSSNDNNQRKDKMSNLDML